MSLKTDPIAVRPVVLAGGSGTRLWPLSRATYPKQFLVLDASQRSLFQQAVDRLQSLAAPSIRLEQALIVCGEEHRFLVLDQLRAVGTQAQLLLEPMGRNTAPALTLAALQALADGGDPVLVVSPADQAITDSAAFTSTLREAVHAAADGAVVILGIAPTHPATGFGYIRAQGTARVQDVVAFVEKPDAATAQTYLDDGSYRWNSGCFVLRASTWMDLLERLRPDIAAATRAAFAAGTADAHFIRPNSEDFAAIAAESVDYAVIEHCPGLCPIHMLTLDAGWSDLGAWDAVWQVAQRDASGNATLGDVMLERTSNSLVHAAHRMVGVVGLDDIVVVETADAVLVARRGSSQDVKQVVQRLLNDRRTEATQHRKVHRPWGWYDSIDKGSRFQVKRIMVKPGASISLQKHMHRAEHWIVVSGTAEVTCGDHVLLLTENQSTYVPLGETHRLSNPGKVPLEIIEVQSGSYLGEDDIIRFEDSYGRS